MAVRIGELRQSHNMSRTELAKLIGISRPTVYAIESGERRMFADEILVIAHFFNASLEWLYGDVPTAHVSWRARKNSPPSTASSAYT